MTASAGGRDPPRLRHPSEEAGLIYFADLTDAFNAWAADGLGADLTGQLAMDGKSIKVSLSDYDKSYQDFVSLVSAFSVERGAVVALSPMRNGQTSEVAVVEALCSNS